jgi:hypothetical protein
MLLNSTIDPLVPMVLTVGLPILTVIGVVWWIVQEAIIRKIRKIRKGDENS